MKLTVDAGLIGLVWVLGLGAVTISLSLILFDLIRPRIPDVFDRRRRTLRQEELGYPLDNGRHDSPPQPSLAPLAWIPYIWKLSDSEVKQTHGVDTTMVLRFFRTMAKLFGILSFFSTTILIPLFATGANKNLSKKNRLRVFGVRILSFANIPKDDTVRLAFVVVFDVFISMYILYALAAELRHLVRYRREYRSSDHPSNYAIIVQNIPPQQAGKSNLEDFWNSLFPDCIEAVIVIPLCTKINRYRREYFEAVRHRQRAEAVIREAELDSLAKQISATSSTPSERGFLSSSPTASRFLKLGESVLKCFKPSAASTAPGTMPLNLEEFTRTRDCTGNPDQPPVTKKSSLAKKIKLTGVFKSWKDPQECIQHWDAKEREFFEKIEVLKQEKAKFDDENGTQSAIVVFKRKQDAAMAAQTSFAASRLQWSVSQAPDVMAIDWPVFGSSSRLVLPRRLLALALTVALTIFWVVPTALIQSLANINSLSETPAFSWLGFVNNLTPEFSGFVQGLLPAMVLEIVMIVVPRIIRWFIMLKRIPSRVKVEQQVLQNMIAFLYFSHLIYIVLSGSLLEYSDEIIRNPSNIVRILARSIPQQGTFMMNIVLLTAVVQTPLSVLQPVRLFKRWMGLKRAWTARDKELVNAKGSLSDHFDSYSFGTIFAVLGIVYSSLTPLLLNICALFFLLAYTATKYKLLFTQTQPWEGFAALHGIALHGVSTGLVVKQITMAGLMVLHKQATLATLEFVLAALISAVIIVNNESVLPVIEHGALADLAIVSTARASEIVSPRDLADAAKEVQQVYQHPSYGPVKEFIWQGTV